ncbi:PREDICTED: nudix hydrolase 8 [Theobroma cacao]|uniref:Nudix hydrolase 8 n=1 Tax=Theobroma cacao TaxID=3641 RepID=A0AB32WX32_THECC|nr:PREDICTED: nudix hydrolase 8 [Theobroma cacao]
MEMMAAEVGLQQSSGFYCQQFPRVPRTSWTQNCIFPGLSKGFLRKSSLSMSSSAQFRSCHVPSINGGTMLKRKGIHVVSSDLASPGLAVELLDAWDDEYNGVIIDTECLPSSANAFASALLASLTNWKLKGKSGIWLKILSEQADLVPIAIQEGFDYHHAEPGYVMLTYWIPDEPCLLPGSPSHQIGIAGFVITDKKEVLVVKEKCPCSCSGVWKLPTGYINKYEDIFSGAVREVKEETGVDTIFQEMVAFRHAHRVAFEKSDLLFVCMLKPLSSDIIVDEKEIQDAKWMPLGEFIEQPFYQEDHMSRKMIEICTAAHEDRYDGFTAQQLISKLDGRVTYLYYKG